MIWVQDDKDKFYIKETTDAVAVIEPGMFGRWHLHIDGQREIGRTANSYSMSITLVTIRSI